MFNGVLSKNSASYRSHAGKRGFIIANGPSIKKTDLLMLKDELTIVVNSFWMHDQFAEISPKYLVLADPLYWERSDVHLYPILNGMVNKGVDPKIWMPISAYNHVNAVMSQRFDVCYFGYDFSMAYLIDVNLSRSIPPLGQNVVCTALLLALHLGMDPVYLVGCDHDFFQWTKESYSSERYEHFYEKPEKEKIFHETESFETMKHNTDILKKQYDLIGKYAKSQGVSILNATKGGHLENFVRVDYDSLFAFGASPNRNMIEVSPMKIAQAAVKMLNDGEADAALVLINDAISRNKYRPLSVSGLIYVKALCLFRMGYIESAISALKDDHGIDSVKKSKIINLIDLRIKDVFVESEISEEDWRDLLSGINLFYVSNNDSTDDGKHETVQNLNDLSEFFANCGQNSLARSYLRDILEIDQSNQDALHNLSVIDWHDGERVMSARRALKMLSMGIVNDDVLSTLSHMLTELGLEDAAESLKRDLRHFSIKNPQAT